MEKTQIKLLLITVLSFVLAGIFLWEGLTTQAAGLGQIKQIVSTFQKSASPSGQTTPSKQLENPAILPKASSNGYVEAKVIRVIDGDTLEVSVDEKQYKLRYIGINTPETVDPRKPVECFGKEASNENKRIVEGKTVYLEKDVSETDKFGRLLRYVYLKLSDGSYLFVNDYLVRAGFAYVDTFPPDVKYQDRFLAAQNEAQVNNRGLWTSCQGK